MKELVDEQIWEAFIAGDDKALAYIYNTYANKLYNYGKQFTKKEEMVQDAIQDVFCELIQSRKKLAKTTSVKFYLFACIRNRVMHALRKEDKYLHIHIESKEAGFQVELLSENSFFRKFFNQETKTILENTFNNLPIRQREAIMLYFYEDMSYQEIADIMQIGKVKSARALVYRALESLSKNLHEMKYHSIEAVL